MKSCAWDTSASHRCTVVSDRSSFPS